MARAFARSSRPFKKPLHGTLVENNARDRGGCPEPGASGWLLGRDAVTVSPLVLPGWRVARDLPGSDDNQSTSCGLFPQSSPAVKQNDQPGLRKTGVVRRR